MSTAGTVMDTFPEKLSFLDLPAEIRNQIYILVLSTDTTNIDSLLSREPVGANRNISTYLTRVQTKFSPYSLHVSEGSGPLRRHPRRRIELRTTNRYVHADPVIWQLNRQIREESRSLYITRFLSVNVHGAQPLDWRSNLAPNMGMKMFERWLASDVEEPLRKGIRQIEVRDWVNVRRGTNEPLKERKHDLLHAFAVFVPLFHISITSSDTLFTVRSAYKLDTAQVSALQDYLNSMATDLERTAWDGDDILEVVRFLRLAMDAPWGNCYQLTTFGEPFSVRFTAVVRYDEVVFEDGYAAVTEWKYVAAEAVAGLVQGKAGKLTAEVEGETGASVAGEVAAANNP